VKIIPVSQWKARPKESGPEKVVKEVIANVRRKGEAALKIYAKKWDGAVPKSWTVSLKECKTQWGGLDKRSKAALSLSAQQLEKWSLACLPKKEVTLNANGVTLTQSITALDSVACYVPGGKYPLVSSVLMNMVPAKIAGVKRRVLVTPAKNGEVDKFILASAHLAGATEVWAVGGAQGVAAAALGAGRLKAVDKIVGPGNAYVTEAKRQLQGEVAIDMLAGPSELLVVVDASTELRPIAIDLMAQSEHGPDSESIVVSRSLKVLTELAAILSKEALTLYGDKESKKIISQVRGLQARSKCETCDIVNEIASEHLHIAVKNPEPLLKKIRNYGTLFLGEQTPVALGDYISGANHVLPTGRGGRYRGGLGVEDFLVRRVIQIQDAKKGKELYSKGADIAAMEGLRAHEMSLRVRLSNK